MVVAVAAVVAVRTIGVGCIEAGCIGVGCIGVGCIEVGCIGVGCIGIDIEKPVAVVAVVVELGHVLEQQHAVETEWLPWLLVAVDESQPPAVVDEPMQPDAHVQRTKSVVAVGRESIGSGRMEKLG